MNEQVKTGRLAKLGWLLPWLWLAAGYLLDLWFLAVPGRTLIDSDMSSEMILAQILNQERSILSGSWFYSTELRVMYLQWFYRIGLLIFPNNWHYARVFGMEALLLLYIMVALLLTWAAGLKKTGVWLTAALLWPFGVMYLVYTLFGGYYLVYDVQYFVVLILLLAAALHRKSLKRRWLCWEILFAVSVLNGLNGVKLLMVFYAPLLLASFGLLFYAVHVSRKNNWKDALHASENEARFAIGAVLATAGDMIGYLCNSKILAKQYSFKNYSFISWNRSDDWFTLDKVIMDYFHQFGYCNGENVLHFGGMASGVGLLLGLLVFICLIRLLWRFKHLKPEYRLFVLLLTGMLFVCSMAFTYFQDYCLYYWQTTMPMGIVILAIELETEPFRLKESRTLAAVLLAGMVTVSGVHIIRREMANPTLAHTGLDKVASWLAENNYTEGYATFWNSNALTEYTNGKVQTWTLYSVDDDSLWAWLQKKEHMDVDPQNPFLLIDTVADYDGKRPALAENGDCQEIYNDGRYAVYLFDSAKAVHAAAETAREKTNSDE